MPDGFRSDRRRCVPNLVPGRDGLETFSEGDRLYQAMLAGIESAQHRLCLESYIFADDAVGWRFAQALAARAREGVEVRLHLDAAGWLVWGSARLARFLRSSPIRVRWFHRWSWREPFRYNRRNHRKLLVVDETSAYLGGFNIHRESSAEVFGEQRWRDTHVRLSGAPAAQARRLFDAFWEGRSRWSPAHTATPTSALIPTPSHGCRNRMRRVYGRLINGARQTIRVSTPYFVPDQPMQRALTAAAARGVDVSVLVPAKSDVPPAAWAARASYGALLGAGVRIFEYQPRMLHCKVMLADGSWAAVGSANLDYRSLLHNHELTVVTRDTELCRALEQDFAGDLRSACEVTLPGWRRRAWNRRLAEAVGWAARRWL